MEQCGFGKITDEQEAKKRVVTYTESEDRGHTVKVTDIFGLKHLNNSFIHSFIQYSV